MPVAYFITGTDTDVGKTTVAAGLLRAARLAGLSTAAIKPVAAGCELTAEGLRNSDALALLAECSTQLDYHEVNPVALAPAIAPHLAAAEADVSLELATLTTAVQRVLAKQADFTLVEGAGGWRVPLNDSATLADLAIALQLPVIVVVAVRLGCISHALLTIEAIERDGLRVAGWVANLLEPQMPRLDENIATLEMRLQAPCLGRVPRLQEASAVAVAGYLDLSRLTI
jgi:dethiobiotin synthetase